ncbi:MAG: TIGR02677 family protein [Actinophytocola sp.]|uniref:TIGR02677 family protein n=1 Tax=Actinophytocola sp. TaxID=1872138 RepID=UPI00132B0A15|nr:TIGR02677 family protein [Actinophytocola sp.]MPZ80533.1 TIGR02677 family protein [Actinophytocola sp.]
MAGEHAFGIEAFALDDRLRLFNFATADKRIDYLWVLRAFDRARANYVVLLHATEVAAQLTELAVDHPDAPAIDGDLTPLLDQLYGWQALDRSYDGARAASLAEYRNRHYVYQFSQAGYRAFRAVEDVLGASLDDATLSRLVFPELLRDLQELASANSAGDAERVYRGLTRLDASLSDMAARAARFYLMLGDLSRTNDSRPEIFLAHKDALLAHLREFSNELARYSPKLAAAIAEVDATGTERLVEHAASADERIFASPAERLSDWRQRWSGLAHWFVADADIPSESERLQAGTVSAISAVLALLRRVTEARRGGVSRESQLRHLAAWFTGVENDRAAHALFSCAFNLTAPRHVSTTYPDPELISTRRSWWDAPAVEISRTLVETGKSASPGAPARVDRNEAGRRRLRAEQLAEQRTRTAAARALATHGLDGRTLDDEETDLLLGLLDLALAARVPVSGVTGGSGSAYGVRLTLRPHSRATTVDTVRGRLHLDRLAVRLEARA